MKITCVSDLHGSFPDLPGGEVLIIAGDLTARDSVDEYFWFRDWLQSQDYEKKILVAGNHDKCIESGRFYFSDQWLGATYLFDSGTEYKGLKFWGSPWTPWFEYVNPLCDAYMLKKELELEEKFSKIPEDTDILITHGPPFMVLDKTIYKTNVGSVALLERVKKLKLKYHIFGHIHEAYGSSIDNGHVSLNVARMNRSYKPLNSPVNIEVRSGEEKELDCRSN
jgi:Icc-related predicted phosphoesterase